MTTIDRGSYTIRCEQPGGDTLATYGGFVAAQGQTIDLLDASAPAEIRCLDYGTAANMCEDPGFELAQKIGAGLWSVVSKRSPLLTDLLLL